MTPMNRDHTVHGVEYVTLAEAKEYADACVREERAACAIVAESFRSTTPWPEMISLAIRSRGAQKEKQMDKVEFVAEPLGKVLAITIPIAEYEELKSKAAGDNFTAAQEEMLQFLYGAGPLEGVWFGEVHPRKRRGYWWRENLRKAFASKPAIFSGAPEQAE